MATNSMTQRLIVGLMMAITLLWLLATALGLSVMEEEYGEMFDGALQETAERLVPLVVDDLSRNDSMDAPQQLQNVSKGPGREYLIYQVRNADGNVLIHSHDAPNSPFAVALRTGFSDDKNYRYYTSSNIDGTIFVQVADAFENRREALVESGFALFIPILALLPLSLAVIWVIVRRTLAPVTELRTQIETKDSGNMEAIKPVMLPRELQPIAVSVNTLLERLRQALDAEREFTANSAHELRTPIAGALAQTQMLVAEIGNHPGNHRAAQIEASLFKLRHLAEKLLQLSRAQSGIGVSDRSVDLVPVLDLLVEDFKRAMPDPQRLVFNRPIPGELIGFYNEDAFGIAMRNLIENAIVHGDSKSPVELWLEEKGRLRVVNSGPVYSPSEISKLTRRFQRGETSSSGSGLGLSIAERFLSQMNAKMEIRSPATDRENGFEVIVTWETDK